MVVLREILLVVLRETVSKGSVVVGCGTWSSTHHSLRECVVLGSTQTWFPSFVLKKFLHTTPLSLQDSIGASTIALECLSNADGLPSIDLKYDVLAFVHSVETRPKTFVCDFRYSIFGIL